MGETQEEARIPPLPTDPILRPVIAGAVDGHDYLYLASGLVEPGEPCTMPASCFAYPGCAELQPCQLRRATGAELSPRASVETRTRKQRLAAPFIREPPVPADAGKGQA